MTSNIPTFQDGDAYLECILKEEGHHHDYESLDRQQISRNIIEVHVICLNCGNEDFVYQYLEESELLIIIEKKIIIIKINDEEKSKLDVQLLFFVF